MDHSGAWSRFQTFGLSDIDDDVAQALALRQLENEFKNLSPPLVQQCIEFIDKIERLEHEVAGLEESDLGAPRRRAHLYTHNEQKDIDRVGEQINTLLALQAKVREMQEVVEHFHKTYAPVSQLGSVFESHLGRREFSIQESLLDIESKLLDCRRWMASAEERETIRVKILAALPGEVINDKVRAADYEARLKPFPRAPIITMHTDVTEWHQIRSFGGGMGKAWYFVGTNDHNRIVARMVLKDTVLSRAASWYDVRQWAWVTDASGMLMRDPLEWLTQAHLSNVADARHVMKVHDRADLYEQNLTYRIYMGYAACGDLHQVLRYHMKSGTSVPEPFLWFLMQAFVETSLVMKLGALQPQYSGNWTEIVHRDLKPANIFLDHNDGDSFARYPRPLVGDFGLAFMARRDDPSNPAIWTSAGTRGYLTSEQLSFTNVLTGEPIDDFKISSPCNVAGFAMILFSLMHLRQLKESTQPFAVNNSPNQYKVEERARITYSAELCDIVQECLAYHPNARPKLGDLQSRIENFLASNERVRNAANGLLESDEEPLLHKDDQQFRLGMIWQEPERAPPVVTRGG